MRQEVDPRHYGYFYQDIFAAAVLADSITCAISEISIDRKSQKGDKFDDLNFRVDGRRERVQLKAHVGVDELLELTDLDTTAMRARIDDLILGFASQSDTADEYRLAVTRGAPEDPELLACLQEVPSTEPSIRGTSTRRFVLRPDSIWPESGTPAWRSLATAPITRDVFLEFCGRFVLETDCPRMSANLLDAGPMEQILLTKLKDDIGVGVWPNVDKTLVDSARSLIVTAYSARVTGSQLERSDVIRALGLRTDYGRVAERFPVDESKRVERERILDDLVDHINRYQRTLVVGPPGAGKSWTLDALAARARKAGFLVATHYCYVDLADTELERRAQSQTLFGSLVAEVLDADSSLAGHHFPRYAAGPEELERLLAEAVSANPDRRILLIVDGLDHVSRIIPGASTKAGASAHLAGELAAIQLPPQAVMVIGSQPGSHLDELREIGTIWEVPSWTHIETDALARRMGLALVFNQATTPDAYAGIVDAIAHKSGGNALYATYLCREVLAQASRDETSGHHASVPDRTSLGQAASPGRDHFTDLIGLVDDLPPFDLELRGYYRWLLDGLRAFTGSIWLPELLALLDFGVTRNELKEIRPYDAHHVDSAVGQLTPVLKEWGAQGGVRIYHESFQRFILGVMEETGADIRSILDPVIAWLEGKGFFEDARAFRFLLPMLIRAGRTTDAISRVGPGFVAESVAAGHTGNVVLSNLDTVARTAADLLDWPGLTRLAELTSGALTCYEEKLTDGVAVLYGRVFAELRGPTQLAERLLFDGRPTHNPRVGLLLCAVCDEAGVPAPWAEYVRAYTEQMSSDNTAHSAASDAAVTKARIRGRLRHDAPGAAVQRVADWIQELQEDTRRLPELAPIDLAMILGAVVGGESLASLIDRLPAGPARAQCHVAMARLVFREMPDRAAHHADLALKDGVSDEVALACITMGASPDQVTVSREKLAELTSIASSSRSQFERDAVASWVAMVQTVALGHPDLLPDGDGWDCGEGWYRCWLRFVIDLAKVRAAAGFGRAVAPGVALALLRELARDTHPFKGDPRACDLYTLQPVIHATVRDALSLVPDEEWPAGLEVLGAISRETTSTLFNSPGGPLTVEALLEICWEVAATPAQRDAAVSFAASFLSLDGGGAYDYETHATHELWLSRLCIASERQVESLEHWQRAAEFLASYGSHKDITIFELLDPIGSVACHDAVAARRMLREVQPLVELVITHTDGRETHHAPHTWHETLAKIDPVGAALLLSSGMTEQGGILWPLAEDVLPAILKSAPAKADPLLLAALWFTVFDPGGHVDGIVEALQSLAESDRSLAELAWGHLVSAVEGDGTSPTAEVASTVASAASVLGLHAPEMDIVTCMPKGRTDSQSAAPRADSISLPVDVPLFGVNDTPLRVVQSLRRWARMPERESPSDAALANALGWRLVELAQEGRVDTAARLLDYAAAAGPYRGYGRAELFEALANGLKRHGLAGLATQAFVLAYSRSTGRDWVRVFGGPDCHDLYSSASELSGTLASRELAGEVARVISSGRPFGVTSRVIELFCATGQLSDAIAAWQASYEVIARRFPATGRDRPHDTPYDPLASAGVSLDDALATLAVARLAHPSLHRKRNAVAGVALLIGHRDYLVAPAIRRCLSMELSLTHVMSLLQLLVEYERKPFPITNELQDQLRVLASTEVLGYRVLTVKLLERASLRVDLPPPRPIDRLVSVDAERDRDIAAELGRGRFENVERLWPDFSSQVCARFDRLVSTDATKERMRNMLEATLDPLHRSLRPEAWYRVDELFEVAVHVTGSQIREVLAREGTIAPDAESRLVSLMLDDLGVAVRFELSRSCRPQGPTPEDIADPDFRGDSMAAPMRDGEYSGWYRAAFVEKQLLLGGPYGHDRIGQAIAMGGIEFSWDHPNGALPVGLGQMAVWRGVRPAGIPSLGFLGPLVGLLDVKSRLGGIHLLCPHPVVLAWGELLPADGLGPLVLNDAADHPAVVARQWRMRAIGTDHLANKQPQLAGCDVLIRGDVFDAVARHAAAPARFHWWADGAMSHPKE